MEKHKDEACDYYEIHEDSMEIINKTMPEETNPEAKQTGEEPTRGKVHFLFSGR